MGNYVTGYVLAYSYLMLAVIISLISGKLLKGNEKLCREVPRKVIHVMCGLGWIIYKIFFQGSYHPIIISSSFIIIAICSYLTDELKIQHGKRDFGLINYTVVMTVLSVTSYIFPSTFDAFGVAVLCLAVGDGMAAVIGRILGKHKWKFSKKKSVEGTIGGFICASLVILIVVLVFGVNLTIPGALGIVAVSMIIELVAGDFDNILIPGVAYILAILLNQL